MSENPQKPQFKVEWIDRGVWPREVPDLRYPEGIDLDVCNGAQGCKTDLPYPAKRCGYYYVECLKCGTNAIITTAGRIDDPRSVKLPCEKAKK